METKTLKVSIGLCVHRGIDTCGLDPLFSLLGSLDPLFFPITVSGDALIDRARSVVSSEFLLNTDNDVLVFIDDDMTYNPKDIERICQIAHTTKSIVGVPYVVKNEKTPHLQAKLFKDQRIDFTGEAKGIVQVHYVGTGIMAIAREVLEEMSKTLPICEPQKMWTFFMPMTKEIEGAWRYLGEDWAFCERARELGVKIYLDPRVRVGHSGRYLYTLGDILRQPRPDNPQFFYTESPNRQVDKEPSIQPSAEAELSART